MSSAPEPEPDWTAGSGEAIEPFSSEPQRLEATLQQDLHRFFLLAPTALRNELFGSLFSRRCTHPFTLHGGNVAAELGLENAMWPALLFVSQVEAVAMETRLERTSSLTQVLGYALMALAVELHLRAPRKYCFALVGTGDFKSQWTEQYSSVTELKIALDGEDPSLFLRTQDDRFRKHEDRFLEIVASLDLAFLSFADLAAYLRECAPPDADASPGAEVYRSSSPACSLSSTDARLVTSSRPGRLAGITHPRCRLPCRRVAEAVA